MPRGVPFTEEKKKEIKESVLDNLENTDGATLQRIAKKLGISYIAIYALRRQDEEFDKAVKELLYCRDESALDLAESKLFSNVNEGKEASVFFLLKTKGKERGYVERFEQAQKEVKLFKSEEDEQILNEYRESLLGDIEE